MAKIRLIRTQIMEYEPKPDYYPKGSTIEDMAKIDIDEIEDLEKEFTTYDSSVIKYEIIE